MKWLTKDQIEKAAEKGTKTALLNCKKHWEQMIAATKKDFEAFNGDVKDLDIAAYCALCKKYYNWGTCDECPLKCRDDRLWNSVDDDFNTMINSDYSDISMKTFREQARKLLAKINETIKKLYG